MTVKINMLDWKILIVKKVLIHGMNVCLALIKNETLLKKIINQMHESLNFLLN